MPLIIFQDNLNRAEDVRVETDDVLGCLWEHFDGSLPDNVRIYEGEVSEATDITPGDKSVEVAIEYLASMQNQLYVVNHPEFFLFGLGGGLLGSLLKVLLLGLVSYLLRPKPPKERNTGDESPNNGLSNRVNRARVKERIPDIYGTVNAVPDLIAKPYFRFESHREVEYAYMCVGRGEFLIEDVRDDKTPIEDISGVSYGVYKQDESPNSGNPAFEYGTPINERVWSAVKSNAVNGQALRAPNASNITGEDDIAFNSPDQIFTNNGDLDFEEYFAVGDNLTIANSVTGSNTVDLNGTYEILSLTNNTIVLVNPSLVNNNWTGPFNTGFTNAKLSTNSDKWIGPFVVEGAYRVICNFIAVNGLYTDDGEDQYTMGVNMETEATLLDAAGNPTATVFTTLTNVNGSAELKNARMNSAYFTLPHAGATLADQIATSKATSWQIRVRRVTETPQFDDRTVVDELQWRDLYGLGYVVANDFGDVTTIQVRTPATPGALSIKQRKFNMRATRKIIGRDDAFITVANPFGFTPDTVQVSAAGLIIRDICLDPRIGNMEEEELDYDSIFSAVAFNQNYFGTLLTRDFGYTFDERDMSAEEMIQIVANAAFFTAYRQGSQLKLNFEKKTALALLQFNHRNKIPASEIRSVTFGTTDDHDGVDLDWVNPDDGATETYQIPYDGSANNPSKLTVPGVTNEVLAHMHAWREFQKITYKNVAVEFEGTAEAATLVRNDRVLVADNTRPDTWDGYITSQNGTQLGISQEFSFRAGGGITYTMFLQHFDGTVEALEVLISPNTKTIIVGTPPRLPLVLDKDMYARTTYIIVAGNNSERPIAFLVEELEPKDPYVVGVSVSNYDDRFYAHDEDFIDGFFDVDVTTTRIIFRETWEDLECPPGQYRHYTNPGGFTSNNAIEVQNNITGVGPSRQGVKHVELDGPNRIWVDLPTDPTKTYDLMMFYSPRPNVPPEENRINIEWNGVQIASLVDTGVGKTTTDWRAIFFSLANPTGSTTRLELISVTDAGVGLGGLIDDIRVRETED